MAGHPGQHDRRVLVTGQREPLAQLVGDDIDAALLDGEPADAALLEGRAQGLLAVREDLEDLVGARERRTERRLGGHEGYVIVGSTETYEMYYEWGTLVGDNQVSVAFEWGIKPKDAEEIIESVLGSIQFK